MASVSRTHVSAGKTRNPSSRSWQKLFGKDVRFWLWRGMLKPMGILNFTGLLYFGIGMWHSSLTDCVAKVGEEPIVTTNDVISCTPCIIHKKDLVALRYLSCSQLSEALIHLQYSRFGFPVRISQIHILSFWYLFTLLAYRSTSSRSNSMPRTVHLVRLQPFILIIAMRCFGVILTKYVW